MKLWYLICLVLAFQSLDTFIEESYEVVYEKSNRTEPVQLLICEELNDLYPNETEIDLKKLQADLYNHFLNFGHDWRRNHSGFKELVRNQTKLGSYLVLSGRVCLVANDAEELEKIYFFLYISPKMSKSFFAISRDTFDLVKMSRWDDPIDQLTVLNKEPPYFDCSRSNAKFRCLNECFKKSFRLARYYYEGNETGLIRLDYGKSNRTIAESERNCFDKCKRENCKMIQLISSHKIKRPKVETFEARPKLSAFDYWLQLIGLIISFAGLSLNEFASVMIGFAQSKVRRRGVRIALFCLKLTIIFVCFASFGYLCARIALDQKADQTSPKEKEGPRQLIQPNVIHLAICVDIEKFENKTMSEIERATDGVLDEALEGIYLNYEGRSFSANYSVSPKVLFFYIASNSRCFLLSIQPEYQMIPSTPKLKIRFEECLFYPNLYLLSENENLNSNSFKYSGYYAFQKRIVKRFRSNGQCIDYEEKYGVCMGRQNCVDRCVSKKFIEKYNKITFGHFYRRHVVDSDWFSPDELNSSQLIQIPDSNRSILEDIRKECLGKVPDEKACEETEFKETFEINQPDYQTIEIDLQFDVVRVVEEEPSWYKLALDISSMETVLFGFTVLSILQMIALLVKTTLRVRENKIVLFLVYLISSFGFTWHTYHILHLVIRGELVATQHYELAKRVQMPELVFCIRFDEELINRNYQLTGNYLEQLTGDITPASTFKSISYLNESSEWVSFNLSQVGWFFLRSMKCFRVEIDQEYDRDQFHFSKESCVLKVNFIRPSEESESRFVYFMTKSKEIREFSKIVHLEFKNFKTGKVLNFLLYSINHETSLYQYEDRFSFIRRHFVSFREDSDDLAAQLLELQGNEHNLRTLKVPLEQDAFDMEMEEDLFEQLYSVQEHRNKRTDSNYQQRFVDNHLSEKWGLSPDFSFNLLFLQKVVFSTNEENIGKLILSLLNLLFIWFDLGVLDLHLHLHLPLLLFSKTNKFLIFSFQCLKKLELSLRKHLKTQRQNGLERSARIRPL